MTKTRQEFAQAFVLLEPGRLEWVWGQKIKESLVEAVSDQLARIAEITTD